MKEVEIVNGVYGFRPDGTKALQARRVWGRSDRAGWGSCASGQTGRGANHFQEALPTYPDTRIADVATSGQQHLRCWRRE